VLLGVVDHDSLHGVGLEKCAPRDAPSTSLLCRRSGGPQARGRCFYARAASWVMARKTKPTTPDTPAMSRTEWALAIVRKVDELHPNMGRMYLTTVVAILWPRHRADDPERMVVSWVAERPAIDEADARSALQTMTETTEADFREAARRGVQEGLRRAYQRAARRVATATGPVATIGCRSLGSKLGVS